MPLPLSAIFAAILIALGLPGLLPGLSESAYAQPLPLPPLSSEHGAYFELLQKYRDGDYEFAVKGMAVLREGRSTDRVFDALESLSLTITGESEPLKVSKPRQMMLANAWAIALPAAAALHLETGFALMQAAEFAAARDHLHIARQIVDYPRFSAVMKLRPELQEARVAFRRDIYLGVLWTLQTDPVNDRLVQHLERLFGEFPELADTKLALGAFEEYQSSSAVIRASKPPTAVTGAGAWRQATQLMRLKNAEKHYREALELDASLAEARLRLGRVLQQRGLMQDARNELEGVFGQPGVEPAIRYLASIFLIDVLEAQGNTAASLARARELVTRYPECQSSHLALSRALEARGQRVQALAALAPLWKEEGARACADPWWSYYLGQVWRVPKLFESLRNRVRGAK